MNRTLKRPMFRMGGSANTGITSGLDKPRQGYKNPGLVDFFPTKEEFSQAKEMFPQYPEIRPGEATSRFLTSFGLDLMGRTPSGNIFQTAALSAKGPTEQLYKDIDERRLMKGAAEADL